MVEKKYSHMSFRVPSTWKKRCQELKIDISYNCRAALYRAMVQADKIHDHQGNLHSKQRAAFLFNGLKGLRVHTETDIFHRKLSELPFKSEEFKCFFLPLAESDELIALAEFLEQGECAEEILQEIYR